MKVQHSQNWNIWEGQEGKTMSFVIQNTKTSHSSNEYDDYSLCNSFQYKYFLMTSAWTF